MTNHPGVSLSSVLLPVTPNHRVTQKRYSDEDPNGRPTQTPSHRLVNEATNISDNRGINIIRWYIGRSDPPPPWWRHCNV